MSRALPFLLFAAAVTLGWNLTGYHLLDPDEGRNAEVAREMARSHDYVIPHLDGLPYLDKPVVYFAASAAAMTVLGPTELAARLPAYIATLATVALLVAFARRRWGPTAGWLAGLAFATMPLALAYAHTAIFDSTLTLCTTAAILWLFEGRTTLAWAALAVGALTKGPIALALPLVAMAAYAGATGTAFRRLVSVRALAVFAALSAPWVLAVTRQFPEFPAYVFALETLRRFTTPSFHRTAPVWYYVPIVAAGAFPWVVPACGRLARWRAAWAGRREPGGAQEAVWLTAWVLAPLTLLTIDQSKLPQYVLPVLPAFALAAARHLTGDGPRTLWRTYAGLATALGVGLVAVPMSFLSVVLPPLSPGERLAIPPTALVLGLALLVSAAGVALAARPGGVTRGAVA
jgi:4-amino-4-deoxy-L-arabinose transferase-like glycosyltransferase